jgi:hypothetical protein
MARFENGEGRFGLPRFVLSPVFLLLDFLSFLLFWVLLFVLAVVFPVLRVGPASGLPKPALSLAALSPSARAAPTAMWPNGSQRGVA